MHNGEIQHYLIIMMVTESGEQVQLTSEVTTLTIGGLHPFYNYNILISAVTTDTGPYSFPINIITSEDSKPTKTFFFAYLINY